MAAVCGFKQNELVGFGAMGAIDVAVGTGVTWLISSATTSLVGGALGGLAHIVTVLALAVIKDVKCNDKLAFGGLLAMELGMPVVFSFAATALGYPVSIPLALLMGVINVASFFVVAVLSE